MALVLAHETKECTREKVRALLTDSVSLFTVSAGWVTREARTGALFGWELGIQIGRTSLQRSPTGPECRRKKVVPETPLNQLQTI